MSPDEHTNHEFFLDVGDNHRLYVHDWGNAKAKTPIIYLHGGPGNGCDDKDKRKFDPTDNRVIFFDQRGSGKSEPAGELQHNDSQRLIEDIEKIASQLKLDQFILFGGSWGSTLALLYGIANPERVAGIIIDGVFTAAKNDNDWLAEAGWRQFYPEVWQQYLKTVPAQYQNNPTAYHFEKALGDNPESAKKSIYEFLKMELALLKLDDQYRPEPYETFDPSGGKIEIFYLANNCFIPEGYIIKNAAKLTMPVYIVQGRYDMVCPPLGAYNLHKALPNSELIWSINGHMKGHEAKNIQKIFLKELLKG